MLDCGWSTAKLLIFSSNVDVPLIYYSHLTSIIIFLSLFALTFIKMKEWPKAPFRLMTISYAVWLFCDLVLWANEVIPNVLFFWSLINIVEPLIFLGAFTFFVSFVEKRSFNIKEKLGIFIIILPTIIMAPIGLSVVGFDYTTCDRNVVEGIAAYYNYFLEFLFLILIIVKTITTLTSKNFVGKKTKILLISLGVSFLLFSFLVANFLGTLLTEYDISQFGHIAVPFFASFLAYITIKYETFEPRILLNDILVAALIILLASLFFARGESSQNYILIVTFVLVIPLAYSLITGIRKEIKARKQIQGLAQALEQSNLGLEAANDKLKSLDRLKTEFLSLASHQLRSPLTAIKGYASMLVEDAFGKMTPDQEMAVKRIYTSAQGLVSIVEDLLNVSKIEQGGMKYEFMPTDIKKVVSDLYNEMKIPAESKGLDLQLDIPKESTVMAIADPVKIKQVFLNIVDNSIKYTQKGFVKMHLTQDDKFVTLAVSDSGIGISPETKEKLFGKFSRGTEGGRINTGGSGLGLYLAKQIAQAHKGDVVIDSEGLGKGSTFTITIPVAGARKNGISITS